MHGIGRQPAIFQESRERRLRLRSVDAENRTIKVKDKPLNWGGTTQLCTRESKFETSEQGDCGNRGFAATGFAAVDMSSGGKTLRFAMP